MTNRPCALIYSRRFADYSYGEEHPFKVLRYRLAYELMEALELTRGAQVIDSPMAPEEALLLFHRPDYLDCLRRFSSAQETGANFFYGLGDVENPVFPGLYDWARLVCGGTLEAVRLVVEDGYRLAFNMAGGWHHAHAARASGFSYLNDAAVAIEALVRRGLRVAYVDLDAHHGDAVQQAFYATDRVLTISLHESGKDFFPQTGLAEEMGVGRGYGYAVNVPFAAHSDDLIFEQALRRIVMPLLQAFRPDLLVTQMGVDALRTDPLTRLEMTTGAFELAARAFRSTGFPWVILGGGGYDKINVARGWSLIWAAARQVEVPDQLPAGFAAVASRFGYSSPRLRDLPRLAHPDDFSRAQAALEKNLAILERRLFPLHGLTPEGRS